MNVLLDTDVLLDVLLDRRPHAGAATEVLNRVGFRPHTAFVAWHTISNLYYLTRPKMDQSDTLDFLREFFQFAGVAPVDTKDILFALDLGMLDFEDAMQVAAAVACRAQRIITRNTRHYRNAPVQAITPEDVLKQGLLST